MKKARRFDVDIKCELLHSKVLEKTLTLVNAPKVHYSTRCVK
jgi:hypothetical protein